MKKFLLFALTLFALSSVVPQNAKAIIQGPPPDEVIQSAASNIIQGPPPDEIIQGPPPDEIVSPR
jgi:hypothetical protein